MHTLKQFISLLTDEMSLAVKNPNLKKYTLDDIKGGFEEMVGMTNVSLKDIDFAYVSGSYSRGQQTVYSDVDIECFSPSIKKEYQDTFKWNDLLISFSVYPENTVRGEGQNVVDQSWAKSVFLSSKPIFDPNNTYETCAKAFLQQEEMHADEIDVPFSKHMRKVMEYRRKMLSALTMNDNLFYNYSTSKFLENFSVVKNILSYGEISSERGQFDVLKEASLLHPNGLSDVAMDLYSPGISVEECINLTSYFLAEMLEVAKQAHERPKAAFNERSANQGIFDVPTFSRAYLEAIDMMMR